MARNLIGTGADQVSLNGMLGELAFQTKDNVNFTGGTGKLSKLDIDAISSQLNVSAVDVFVYDTRKDTDGGAWRKRCTHTTWYNETLNTNTRGSRKEFPSVAVIVATSNSVIIYDGDDPMLPMWMVFNAGGGDIYLRSGSLGSVVMLNAVLVAGSPGGDAFYINFISEAYRLYAGNIWYNSNGGAIVKRNTIGAISTLGETSITNRTVNDLSAIVHPNTPIDSSTGLPNPTIAVACGSGSSGGVSVIKYDGSVVSAVFPQNMAGTVSWLGTDYIAVDTTGYPIVIKYSMLPFSGSGYMSTFMPGNPAYGWSHYSINEGYGIPVYVPSATNGAYKVGSSSRYLVSQTDKGLGVVDENFAMPAYGMYSLITTKYNTGWLGGNTRGAWLCDTSQETIVSSELVSNGTFDTNTAGWSPTNATLAVSSGELSITSSAAGNAIADQVITGLVVGKTYVISAFARSNLNTNLFAGIMNVSNGASGNNSTSLPLTTYTFVATSTSFTLRLFFTATAAGQVAYFDNVSVRVAEVDRSINASSLLAIGSLTKTPVAQGADLVAYSGFSSTSYLYQPYRSSLQNTASDIVISVWLKVPTGNPDTRVFWLGGDTNAETGGISIGTYSGYIRNHSGGVWNMGTNPYYYTADTWTHFVMVVHCASGKVDEYANGKYIQTWQGGSSIFATANQPLYVGTSKYYVGQYNFSGSMALLKIFNNVLSNDQILKMYNDEKTLFQENAKCTLYGTSDSIIATAYDEDTKLLHVGTSSGRSVFQGLRRIDNTTTAVTASISAANGLVAEQ